MNMTPEQREAVKKRLIEIEEANGGRLTPDAVVRDAKRKDSPLHSCFEWDVKKAAAAHWIEQARDLITSIRIVVKTGEQGYVSVTKVRTDADMAREVLVAEFGRVADMLRRARELAAALEAQSEVEALLQGVVGLRQRFMDQPPAQ